MSAPLIGPTAAPDLHVMTFNIRRRMGELTWPPADRWRIRRPRLEALLRQEQPTILGTQEALTDQAAAVQAALGPSYRTVGHGRRRGPRGPRGEGCPLFFDAARLEILAWRQIALSDHPGEPGSTSWGNVIPRVAVIASFRDRVTGAELLVVNTHLDVFSARARLRAAEQLHALAAAQSLPTILLGDTNADATSPPLRALTDDGMLTDAWNRAEALVSPEWRTYGGYRAPRPGRRIDALLVSPGIRVRRAGINAERIDGGWPSDHLPVQAVLRMPEPKPDDIDREERRP